jgi:hypothetical protein
LTSWDTRNRKISAINVLPSNVSNSGGRNSQREEQLKFSLFKFYHGRWEVSNPDLKARDQIGHQSKEVKLILGLLHLIAGCIENKDTSSYRK